MNNKQDRPSITIFMPGCHVNVVKHNEGFTLIETLVAMMLLAIALVTILQLFSGGLRSAKVAQDYDTAIFHAQEIMDQLLLSKKLSADSVSGDFGDGYSYQASIEEIESDSELYNYRPLASFNIKVVVNWMNGKTEKQYQLETIHLAAKNKR